jgi:O-antigen/teichoic acid export membrane protein
VAGPAAASPSPAAGSSYGRGARLLSLGIGTTGLVTFAYFSLASHVLDDADYTGITLLWSLMFVIVSVIYRPIEQLLSRTIAERRARGLHGGHPLRTPMLLQASFAAAFAAVALALRGPLQDDVFDGSATLYWILVAGVLSYAASYFARGWLAGHQWFGLYGGLVLLEATSRCCFALAVVVGLAEGQSAVALGMAAAPLVSLVVVPAAFARRPAEGRGKAPRDDLALGRGGRFALAVLAVMLAEQTLLNAAVIAADATTDDAAVAGLVFNALLIVRAPLQLFQAVQGSLLPHLAGLHATEDRAAFTHAVRITVLAIAGFAAAVAGGLVLAGPWAMDLLFDDAYTYGRWGLAVIAIGMGLHLVAGTLNQAALARDHATAAAAAWVVSAAVFVAWMLAPVVGDELLRAELGYCGAAALLCVLLAVVYARPAQPRRTPSRRSAAASTDSPAPATTRSGASGAS